MSKTYRIPIRTTPEELLSKATSIASHSGWTLRGDTDSGYFSGDGVRGTYKRNGNELILNITDKPFLASWSDVDSGINDLFG